MANPTGRDNISIVERVIGLEHGVANVSDHLTRFEAESADFRERTRHHLHDINNMLTIIVGKLEKLERVETDRMERSLKRRAFARNLFTGLISVVGASAAIAAVVEFLRSLRTPPH